MREKTGDVTWSVHLSKPPARVFQYLSTDEGRVQFWAESAIEENGTIMFEFSSGETLDADILATDPPEEFALNYFGSPAIFNLSEDGDGGTILTLTHKEIDNDDRCVMMAGWVSVLLTLKATVNHSVDLRNHNPKLTWENSFVGN